MQTDVVRLIQSVQEQNKVLFIKNGSMQIAKGNVCLRHELGQYIDIIWDSLRGNMFLINSHPNKTIYTKLLHFEILKDVQFRHSFACPYIQKQFQKSQKFYKSCACLLIIREEDNHVLVTRRKLTLNSFPGAWVLPGGHLDKNQGLIEGACREALEEVGFDPKSSHMSVQNNVMAWESAYCIQNRIVSSGVVLFFSAKTKNFQVKIQQNEIQQFIWKNILDQKDENRYNIENKNGYGQAHLNYLSVYRFKNHDIEETKPWIQTEKAINSNQKPNE